MPIDWFTVVAQAINFLILVWLLKRFLYKPILHAIDEREKGIAAQLAEAEAKKAEAQKERDDFQHKNEAFDQERAALLKKATDEAKAERQRLLDEARKDADSLRAKRQEALRNEQRNLSQEIIRWTQKEVFAITRKTLADLAATSLEERMGDGVRPASARVDRRGQGAVGCRPQDLDPTGDACAARSICRRRSTQRYESAVNETFSADIHIQFETVPELVSGIELSANGQKVAWSIADYLATLEKSAGELLHEDAKPESKPEASPSPRHRRKPSRSPNGRSASTSLNRWPRPQRRTIE